mmetsp:Transcript_31928/g.71728  ORF Transcript_31928/g.71728 Transcript_31928/m.71728 type:complete len:491 (+) Transcript_31928:71-1543(+)
MFRPAPAHIMAPFPAVRLCLLFASGASVLASMIPVPSPAQLRYQSTDFVALIHFNMATFAKNGDPGCNWANWNTLEPYAMGKTRDPATFNPTRLNTSQWMESITALGANIAVLTAKHGCGFLLWPTKARLPDGSAYNYSVGSPGAAIQYDVLQRFVDAAKEAGVGYGFYYSIMKNFYLCRGFGRLGANTCKTKILPGQLNLTDEEYHNLTTQLATELWTQYGDLTDIWTDSVMGGLGPLMSKLQPQAVGTPANPKFWCGTESGYPSRDVGGKEIWNMGKGYFGQANGTEWIPKFCDPTLIPNDVWFFEPGLSVRTLAELIDMYHDIVGRGMIMEIAFSINRLGLVEDSHARAYRLLGEWVQECYASPLASVSGTGTFLQLRLPARFAYDRVMLQEDIVLGQRVRKYIIERSTMGGAWVRVATASAIGRKRIHLFSQTIQEEEGSILRLTIQDATATPMIRHFGVYAPCRRSEHDLQKDDRPAVEPFFKVT